MEKAASVLSTTPYKDLQVQEPGRLMTLSVRNRILVRNNQPYYLSNNEKIKAELNLITLLFQRKNKLISFVIPYDIDCY